MATPNPARPTTRSRRRQWTGWFLLVLGAAVLVLYWRPLKATALTGAAYGARVACACRYVAGRTLGDCRRDFEPGMGPVMLSENAGARSVTARYPLLASQTATFTEGAGCMLEPWRD